MFLSVKAKKGTGVAYHVFVILPVLIFVFVGRGILIAQGYETELTVKSSTSLPGDRFGSAVDLDGFHALVGAPGESGVSNDMSNSGAAYFCEYEINEWVSKEMVKPGDNAAGDNFGHSVALDSGRAVIGAPGKDENGKIYFYSYDKTSWNNVQEISALNDSARFGEAVDMDGDYAIVGAPNDQGENTGAVYVYWFNGLYWIQQARFVASDSVTGDEFGRAVAISGKHIIVGSGNEAAYIFEYVDGGWTQTAKLTHDHPYTNFGIFGRSVDIDHNTAIVGAVEYEGSIVYIFTKQDGGWMLRDRLDAFDTFFGHAIAISKNLIVVGAYGSHGSGDDFQDQGSVYVYRYDGEKSPANIIYQGNHNNSQETWQWIGYSVAVDNGVIMSGAPRFRDYTGIAYMHEITARPSQVNISNAAYDNRTKISWKKKAGQFVEGFLIYRDHHVIDTAVAGSRAYYDYEGIPGKIHAYGVVATGSEWGTTMPYYALGWKPNNGSLEGKVETLYGSVVDSVFLDFSDPEGRLGAAMQFYGNDDHVIFNPYHGFPENALTVSFWIKTTDKNDTYFFSYATPESDNTFLMGTASGLGITIANTNGQYEFTQNTGVSINDGQWHHLAVTWQSSDGEINLLKDGKIVFTGLLQEGNSIPATGSIVLGQDQDIVGGGFNPNQAFGGKLDEVRIWNKVRTADEIQADMNRKLKGNERGLVSYWTFDDLPDRTPNGIAGDYGKETAKHGIISGATYTNDTSPVHGKLMTNTLGKYSIDNIYYGESARIEVTPSKSGHGFDPVSKSVYMDINVPEQEDVNFIDTTAMTVTGVVHYEGTDCKVMNAEIFKNGISTNVKTNAQGKFQLTIEQPDIYRFEVKYGDSANAHGFIPPFRTLSVEKSVFGLEFADTTRHTLYGRFQGPCDVSLGSAVILITSTGHNEGLFRDTVYTDTDGYYNISLPAQKYVLEILDVTLNDPEVLSETVLQYFTPDIVDLTWTAVEHNFTYRQKPIIQISGWPESGGGNYRVPILEQSESFILEISVLDVWGEDTCHVDQGSVTIFDDISDIADKPVTLQLDNGLAFYQCWPGEPNLLSGGEYPYQKSMQVVAEVGEEIAEFSQWAVVTGSHLRGSEFYTIATPEMPLWVLHDPPGDESFSFFSKDSTYTRSVRSSWHYQGGAGVFAELRPGIIASFGWSAGLGAETTWSTDFGLYGIIDASFLWGRDQEQTSTKIVTFTANQEFRTSASENFLGDEGDVYIGASFNDEFALADILEYDWNMNEVDRDTALVFMRTDFATDFMYTESYIKKTLVPQLRELARISVSEGNTSQANQYNNQVAIWNQHIEKNNRLKQEDNPETRMFKNYSFSAGTYTTNSYTTHPRDTAWLNFDQFTFDYEGRLGAGAVVAGCTYEVGMQGYYHTVTGKEYETKIQTSETYGYTLADNDPGDVFSVDVSYRYRMLNDGTEEMYGPPIFRLITGVSSNPWEKGTQARDGVNLMLDKYVQYNVDPAEHAAFTLYLGNTSESGEEREYHLSVIQSSNLEGAIIRVGGVVIEDYLSYTIPAGEQIKATLSVERGPVAYDYEKLKVKFYAPGDESTIADTVTFSVHYISPCSDVNLLQPVNNWIVNASNNDTLRFVINEYDLENPHLRNIKLQYRRIGDSWTTAFTYPKDDLSFDYILEYWDISSLVDGAYEIRAVSDCGQKGVNYSAIASGVIDRSALLVQGTPQPSDNILNLGEDIFIAFSGEIDDAYLSAKQITLMTADDSTNIACDVSSYQNRVYLTPSAGLQAYENQLLIATVAGIRDIYGNRLARPVSWKFRVNMNPLFWTISNRQTAVYQNDESKITATLRNAGAEAGGFTITRYPQWLTPDIINGTIPANGEQVITFSINTQINIGSYRDTVFVATASGEEILQVSLKVLIAPPDWKVNASEYSYSMNITAQLFFNDTLSRDIYDKVSVHINDEVRGVANVEYLSAIDQYMAFITVYSNQPAGELLTFRMWDASEGKAYAYYGSGYAFAGNTSLGTISGPVMLEPDANVQTFDFSDGWTWFSFNVNPGSQSLINLLQNFKASDGDVIKSQYGYSQYYSGIGWRGSLRMLQTGQSYQIHLQNPGGLSVTGKPVNVGTTQIQLNRGWTWIANLNQNIVNVNDALANISAYDGDRIKSQTEFALYSKSIDSWGGSLKNLIPGQGYMLFTAAGGALSFPFLGKNVLSFEAKPDWELDYKGFEYSMCFTAVVEFNERELRDSTLIVGAFKDDVCRGLAQPQYIEELDRYMLFLNLYSNKAAGDSIILRVYEPETDKLRDVRNKIAFQSDAIIGDPGNPALITAKPIGDELVPYHFYLNQNYPNPFNGTTTIEYGIPGDEKVKLVVYNTIGQKVITLVNRSQKAGRYKISFDATAENLASGLYIYYLKAGYYEKRLKFVFIK